TEPGTTVIPEPRIVLVRVLPSLVGVMEIARADFETPVIPSKTVAAVKTKVNRFFIFLPWKRFKNLSHRNQQTITKTKNLF
ncbi:MAG: hypothetical protein SWZ49_26805, partial [Cyanobacteriota bacterium]|nr:hypothetical protein [Cyanobacteriota bacterium]